MIDERNLPDMSHYAKCRRMRLWHRLNPVIRIVTTFAVGFFNIFYLGMASVKKGIILIYGSMFLYVFVLVMALITLKNRKHLTWAMLALLGVGMLTGLINPLLGAFPFLLYLWQIKEIEQMAWLCEQPGYPTFNIRLTEQEECVKEKIAEDAQYIPKYDFGAMNDISGDGDTLEQAKSERIYEMPDVENYFIPKQTQE